MSEGVAINLSAMLGLQVAAARQAIDDATNFDLCSLLAAGVSIEELEVWEYEGFPLRRSLLCGGRVVNHYHIAIEGLND